MKLPFASRVNSRWRASLVFLRIFIAYRASSLKHIFTFPNWPYPIKSPRTYWLIIFYPLMRPLIYIHIGWLDRFYCLLHSFTLNILTKHYLGNLRNVGCRFILSMDGSLSGSIKTTTDELILELFFRLPHIAPIW